MNNPRARIVILVGAGALTGSALSEALSQDIGAKLVAGPEDMRPVTRSFLEDEPALVAPYAGRAPRSKDWESRNKPYRRKKK